MGAGFVFVGIVVMFVAFFYVLKKDLRGDLATGRVGEGTERVFPATVSALRRDYDLDVEGMTPREAVEAIDAADVPAEEAVKRLREAIDGQVRAAEQSDGNKTDEGESPDAMLSALWWTMGLIHYDAMEDSDTALDCFDIADALADGDAWARTEAEEALGRVDEELDIDYDGPPPGASGVAVDGAHGV